MSRGKATLDLLIRISKIYERLVVRLLAHIEHLNSQNSRVVETAQKEKKFRNCINSDIMQARKIYKLFYR